jgi:hypothetical protein
MWHIFPHKRHISPHVRGEVLHIVIANPLKNYTLTPPEFLTYSPALLLMADSRPRIPIPTTKDPAGVLELGGAIHKKHLADGANSPIRGQLKTDFEAVSADIAEGIKDDAEAKALTKQLEAVYERRNARVARVQPLLGRVSKALQSEYGPGGVRRLGDYGFTVNG